MARYRIRVLGLASGIASSIDGAWVQYADVDALQGRGQLDTTRDPNLARQFDSARDAWAYWGQTSTVRPTRPDGRPNRPLTAYTVIVEPIGPRL